MGHDSPVWGENHEGRLSVFLHVMEHSRDGSEGSGGKWCQVWLCGWVLSFLVLQVTEGVCAEPVWAHLE